MSDHTSADNAFGPWLTALAQARRIVAFTGAGISTDSGIPDYRGTGGQYERYQPVYFQDFLASETQRRSYWEHKAAVWPPMRDAVPGPGHRFLVELWHRGILHGVITQNIDGLHEKSGLPEEAVVNLHGTNLAVECLDCSWRRPAGDVLDPLAGDVAAGRPLPIPHCPQCGGLVKPATVMFGQNLDPHQMERAAVMAGSCDLLLAMGSTLEVQPAASFPVMAHRSGAAVAIITRGPTPLDSIAALRWDGPIASFVQAVQHPDKPNKPDKPGV